MCRINVAVTVRRQAQAEAEAEASTNDQNDKDRTPKHRPPRQQPPTTDKQRQRRQTTQESKQKQKTQKRGTPRQIAAPSAYEGPIEPRTWAMLAVGVGATNRELGRPSLAIFGSEPAQSQRPLDGTQPHRTTCNCPASLATRRRSRKRRRAPPARRTPRKLRSKSSRKCRYQATDRVALERE